MDRPALLNRAFGKVFHSVQNETPDMRGASDPRTRWALQRFWQRLNHSGTVDNPGDLSAGKLLGLHAVCYLLASHAAAKRNASERWFHSTQGS